MKCLVICSLGGYGGFPRIGVRKYKYYDNQSPWGHICHYHSTSSAGFVFLLGGLAIVRNPLGTPSSRCCSVWDREEMKPEKLLRGGAARAPAAAWMV